MADYAKAGRKAELQEQQAAALVKFDRMLQELERLGGQRIKPLPDVIESFDIESLKSIVFDIEAALGSYKIAQGELQRIGK